MSAADAQGQFQVTVTFEPQPLDHYRLIANLTVDGITHRQLVIGGGTTATWTIEPPKPDALIHVEARISGSDGSNGPVCPAFGIPGFLFHPPKEPVFVKFDGRIAAAEWAAPAGSGTLPPEVEMVLVDNNGKICAAGPAGETGGALDVGSAALGAAVGVGVRYRNAGFVGAVGPTRPLMTQSVSISAVEIAEADGGYKVSATLVPMTLKDDQTVTVILAQADGTRHSATAKEGAWTVTWTLAKATPTRDCVIEAAVGTPASKGPTCVLDLPDAAFDPVTNIAASFEAGTVTVNFDCTQALLAPNYELTISDGTRLYVSNALPAVCEVAMTSLEAHTVTVRPGFRRRYYRCRLKAGSDPNARGVGTIPMRAQRH